MRISYLLEVDLNLSITVRIRRGIPSGDSHLGSVGLKVAVAQKECYTMVDSKDAQPDVEHFAIDEQAVKHDGTEE